MVMRYKEPHKTAKSVRARTTAHAPSSTTTSRSR